MQDILKQTLIDHNELHDILQQSVYAAKLEDNDVRRAVVQRDGDVMTHEQVNEQWPEVEQAMLKELQTWATLKCCSRKLRKDARNIIDVRWVLK